MAETNKSQMMSEAEIIEAINADSLISVSLGAGQPQKNVKMSTLASVAAGLIVDSPGFLSKKSLSVSDANQITNSGFYMNTGQISNNLPLTEYGILICFSFGTALEVVQLYIPALFDKNQLFIRQYSAGGWRSWSNII